MLYVSRYSNPELKTGNYTAVRISIGAPKWELGYEIAGDIKLLMPFGMLNQYEKDEFAEHYKERLNGYGIKKIQYVLNSFEKLGKDVVLLCYEDVREESQWCHRTVFAEWYEERTGIAVPELPDQTQPKKKEKPQKVAPGSAFDMIQKLKAGRGEVREGYKEECGMQLSLFSLL